MSNALEALATRVGDDLGVTRWETLTQEDVSAFGVATRATEWIHSDPDRAAREGPFGVPVVQGYLVLALATSFVTQLLGQTVSAIGVNVGVDRVRFIRPIPVGSRVRARGELRSVEQRATGYRTIVHLVYELDGQSEPPCVADVVSLLIPAPAAAD